jgi:hypothetical protein
MWVTEAAEYHSQASHVLVNFGCNFVADLAKLLQVGFMSSGEAPMGYVFVVLVLDVRWHCALGIPVFCKFWVHCCCGFGKCSFRVASSRLGKHPWLRFFCLGNVCKTWIMEGDQLSLSQRLISSGKHLWLRFCCSGSVFVRGDSPLGLSSFGNFWVKVCSGFGLSSCFSTFGLGWTLMVIVEWIEYSAKFDFFLEKEQRKFELKNSNILPIVPFKSNISRGFCCWI